MRYANLHELYRGSASSRRFFLSLPAEDQLRLGEYSEFIHSAAQLHEAAMLLGRHDRGAALSESLFPKKEK